MRVNSSCHTAESSLCLGFDKQTVTLIESRYPSCLSLQVFLPAPPPTPGQLPAEHLTAFSFGPSMVAKDLGIGFQVASLGTWHLSTAHLQAPCSLGQADLVPLAESKGTDPMIGKALFTSHCL